LKRKEQVKKTANSVEQILAQVLVTVSYRDRPL